MSVLHHFYALRASRQPSLAILVDPDSVQEDALRTLAARANAAGADFFFVGGSLMLNDHIRTWIPLLKSLTDIPVVLFPGSLQQIVPEADALLFLSLISGRNPDLLIGTHVQAAPLLRQAGIETMATGYMLIESGRMTTAHYISNTLPIPRDKPDIAACTAMAGEMLGLKLLYMDGGSGAEHPVSARMIAAVRQCVDIPLIVGGGIRSAEAARAAWQAGADTIVIGNAFEKDPNSTLLDELAALKNELAQSIVSA